MSQDDTFARQFLPHLEPEVRELAHRYAILLGERGAIVPLKKGVDVVDHTSARIMVMAIALSKQAFLEAHASNDADSWLRVGQIQRDLIAQMFLYGFWKTPWIELVYREFPGLRLTQLEIEAYGRMAETDRANESQRVTDMSAWCAGVRDVLEFYHYDVQTVDIEVIQLLSVRWMVQQQRSALHDRRHAQGMIRGASQADHQAWTEVLDLHFPEH